MSILTKKSISIISFKLKLQHTVIMDLKQIQEIQIKTIMDRKWDRFNATQVFSHLIEELGEIVSHFLYEEEYKVKGIGHKENKTNLKEEFGQAFNLFLQLAYLAKVDLESAWMEENKKIESRFPKEEWQKLAESKK